MKRAKPKLSGDLRLRSGERAHNRMVMEELARQQKAKKQAKKKDPSKNEQDGETKSSGASK